MDDLTRRYTFSLLKLDDVTGRPALNVQTNKTGSRIFRLVPREQVNQIIRSIYEHPGEGALGARCHIQFDPEVVRRHHPLRCRKLLNKADTPAIQAQTKESVDHFADNKRGLANRFHSDETANDRYRYVCVIVDMYSKYLWAFPLRERSQYKRSSNKYNQVMENIIGTDFVASCATYSTGGWGSKIMQSDNEFGRRRTGAMKEKGTRSGIPCRTARKPTAAWSDQRHPQVVS